MGMLHSLSLQWRILVQSNINKLLVLLLLLQISLLVF